MVYALWQVMRAALALGLSIVEPGPWQELDFEGALAQADRTDRPVLVYFSSPICPACRVMDTRTWPDDELSRTMRDSYVAIRPSPTPDRELERELGVIGYPTLIRFEEGKEIARLVGYWEPERVLAWLNEPGSQIAQGDPRTMALGDVHDLAMDRLLAGEQEQAGEALIVFWERCAAEPGASPTLRWLRRDRYPSLLTRACENEATRRQIEERAKSLGSPGLDTDTHPSLVRDWVVLMLALGEDEALTDWAKGRLAESPTSLRDNEPLYDHLLESGHVREAGLVVGDRMRTRWLARLEGRPTGNEVSDAAPAQVVANEHREARSRVERMCESLEAAGRTDEAQALRRLAGNE